MFFLGLLSTPLPYLLLAAFYFFGFALGVFNNSTNDESCEINLSKNLMAENVESQGYIESADFYVSFEHFQLTQEFISDEKLNNNYFPDITHIKYLINSYFTPEPEIHSSHFSRPPPLKA